LLSSSQILYIDRQTGRQAARDGTAYDRAYPDHLERTIY
jgi:hypothetical protein